MNRITFAGYLVLTATTIFPGCGSGATKRALSGELKRHPEIIQNEMPVPGGSYIYNTDIITMLYDKGEDLLSARWVHMENMDQLLFAIRNSYLEGLRPGDYHLAELESLVDNIVGSVDPDMADIARLEFLLSDAFLMLSAQIKSQLDHGQMRTVNLTEPVPVHILYLTAWADDEGLVYLRRDVYDRDQSLLKALRQSPPGANQL